MFLILAPAWSDNLPLAGVLVAFVLYQVGGRQRLYLVSGAGLRRPHSTKGTWRSICFYAGLVTIVAALQPPLDPVADDLFWVHMVQHMLLLALAAPLLIIAGPWMRLWAGFPLGFRRTVARSVVLGGWARPLRTVGRFLASPPVAWLMFNFILIGWHVPYLYDLAVRNQIVHDLEHTTFLVFALVFWGQLIDSSPFHSSLDYMRRFFYLAASMFPSWVLALIMVFSGTPLYPAYQVIDSPAGTLAALNDQQMAGAIMWMIGSIPFAIAGFWLIYMWVQTSIESTAQGGRGRRRAAPPARDRLA